MFKKNHGGIFTTPQTESERRLEILGRPLPDKVQSAVGKTIVCYDQIPRRVVEITWAFSFPWFYIINEQDPDSQLGHYVTTYSLTRQVDGYPPASKELDDQFIHHAKRVIGMDAHTVEDWIAGKLPNTRLELE